MHMIRCFISAEAVIPAKAGIHVRSSNMDPRFRGDDGACTTTVLPEEARIHKGIALCATLALLVLVSCQREKREFQTAPPGAAPPGDVRMASIVPGPARPGDSVAGPYGDNAYGVSEGQRLFTWYNCTGCHSNGGGGMGPPLMDDEWIYGSSPENIFESIAQGRPNGMPAFGERISNDDIWKLAAYVRSLSALTPSATRSARTDHMMVKPGSESLTKPQKPRSSSLPPKAVTP